MNTDDRVVFRLKTNCIYYAGIDMKVCTYAGLASSLLEERYTKPGPQNGRMY